MELYKIGMIKKINKSNIILESNYNGYSVIVARPQEWEIQKIQKIYLYYHVNEYIKIIYGFISFEEYILFINLISINNIGPKKAINILSHGVKELIIAIVKKNEIAIKQSFKTSLKLAKNIIFLLYEKYLKYYNKINEKNQSNQKQNQYDKNKIILSLKQLGFNKNQIALAINKIKIDDYDNIETIIKNCIKIIAEHNETKIETTM